MKILFVNLSGMCFTVLTPDSEPLGGTKSSLCYLARALTARGHDITIAARNPEGMPERVAGVRHVAPVLLLNGDFAAAENFDVIIALNAPVAGPSLRAMAPNALIILWSHLAPDHSAIDQLRIPVTRDSYDGIVYVSNWQRKITEEILGFTKTSIVIGNGFAPAFENMFASAVALRAAKQNRAAYTTTPFRGLQILLGAMESFGEGTTLDVYSSMKVYQSTVEDKQYEALYDYAKTNPQVHYHGAVAQGSLAERLKPVAFFTYPSTYAETFCIAALEARAAGLKVLTTATAALPEVLQNKADYIKINMENQPKMIADFRAMLRGNVQRFLANPNGWAEERFADLRYVNENFTWAHRAKAWEGLLLSRNFS